MNNDLNNNNSTDSRVKSTKSRIIKIILYLSILIGTILLLVVSCNKNKVSAYTSYYRRTLAESEIMSSVNYQTILVDYFSLYDDVSTNTPMFSLISYKLGDRGLDFELQTYSTPHQVVLRKMGSFGFKDLGTIQLSENDTLAFAWTSYNNKLRFFIYRINPITEYISLVYDSLNNESIDFGYNANESFESIIYTQFWLTERYTINNSEAMGTSLLHMLNSVPSKGDPYQYRNEYIFGDLVSSFLNIKFAEVNIGGVSYDLTLGILLLFILGLGALFIVVKVFLGG